MKLYTFLLLCLFGASALAGEAPHRTAPPNPASNPVAGSAEQQDDADKANAVESVIQDGDTQVTIIKKGEQTVEEYRVGGKLYMIKITPKHGRPYYLIDDRGDGRFARQEGLDSGVRVPHWIIKKF
jgi:hypothetical protein